MYIYIASQSLSLSTGHGGDGSVRAIPSVRTRTPAVLSGAPPSFSLSLSLSFGFVLFLAACVPIAGVRRRGRGTTQPCSKVTTASPTWMTSSDSRWTFLDGTASEGRVVTFMDLDRLRCSWCCATSHSVNCACTRLHAVKTSESNTDTQTHQQAKKYTNLDCICL